MNANIIIPIFFGIFTFSFADDFYEEPEFLGITECVDHGFFVSTNQLQFKQYANYNFKIIEFTYFEILQ